MPNVRQVTPAGITPAEEWHGPYEVVQDPTTGKYHVVDNTDRYASLFTAGFYTAEQAIRSRDAIDADRSAREKAKGVAEEIYGGAMEILDPLGTDDSRQSEKSMAAGTVLLTAYQDPARISYDADDRPYYRLDDPAGSGWFAVDYATTFITVRHVAAPEVEQDRITIPGSTDPGFFTPGERPDGWDATQLADLLRSWVSSYGDDYANNAPDITAWQRQKH